MESNCDFPEVQPALCGHCTNGDIAAHFPEVMAKTGNEVAAAKRSFTAFSVCESIRASELLQNTVDETVLCRPFTRTPLIPLQRSSVCSSVSGAYLGIFEHIWAYFDIFGYVLGHIWIYLGHIWTHLGIFGHI